MKVHVSVAKGAAGSSITAHSHRGDRTHSVEYFEENGFSDFMGEITNVQGGRGEGGRGSGGRRGDGSRINGSGS